jgi:hypothetical protein
METDAHQSVRGMIPLPQVIRRMFIHPALHPYNCCTWSTTTTRATRARPQGRRCCSWSTVQTEQDGNEDDVRANVDENRRPQAEVAWTKAGSASLGCRQDEYKEQVRDRGDHSQVRGPTLQHDRQDAEATGTSEALRQWTTKEGRLPHRDRGYDQAIRPLHPQDRHIRGRTDGRTSTTWR